MPMPLMTSFGVMRGPCFCFSTQVLPFLVMPSGQVQAVPALFNLAGERQMTGSTHFPPLGTNPDRQTQSVPAALGTSGGRQTIVFTHSLPRSV